MGCDQYSCFEQIWLVDFEFKSTPGNLPIPVCLVAHELRSGQTLRRWRNELGITPPYDVSERSLFVAYYASAETSCHKVLKWPTPKRILDLFTEFRCLTNGKPTRSGNGLLGAMAHFGLDCIDAGRKDAMRELILSDGPFSQRERADILDYCESDVIALAKLLPCMLPTIDLSRALLRGRYMAAAAAMECNGIPIDVETLDRLKERWPELKPRLIGEVDRDFGVYEGETFKQKKFAAFLARHNIPWPHLESGRLDLQDDTFRDMSRAYPVLGPLRELRSTLSSMRLVDLAVGYDHRNRTMLSAFSARTSRNQPSNAKSIFGPSTWIRGLIKPPYGRGVAYIDWEQQEFGIAAALSHDLLMQDAYSTGDPYLAFAKQAGAVPADATKASHKAERDRFKACVLAVQYGMSAPSLARRIGQSPIEAQVLLDLHRQTYKAFWKWSDGISNYAALYGRLHTVFGWPIQVDDRPNDRSLRNFPVQANGAEMLRLACIEGIEAGIRICMPVHDAVLIEAPLEVLDARITQMQGIMARASEIVLDGFALRTDAKVVRYPDRYMDDRGVAMWETLMRLLNLGA